MKTRILTLFIVFLLVSSVYGADKKSHFEVSSPDKKITLTVVNNKTLQWAVTHDGQTIIDPSPIAMMGVKGWKIDFIDRDDQLAVASTYEIAKLAAEYEFLVDYHGVFKPTGLQRTYPNVVGYEGVYGLENFKWADKNAPRYAVTIPFIRNMAGPMDYTSGSMRNVTDADFCPRNHAPMSKGTRCNQIAQYVVFEVPLQMLSDSPTLYYKEQESTDFITEIPATFDETVALDGKVGEYVAVARRKGETWFVGAMTNWNARELTIDCSFLDEGTYNVVIFSGRGECQHTGHRL